MSQPEYAIGLDLGGTHIKSVLLDRDGHILHRLHVPTDDHKGDAPWKVAMKTCFEQLRTQVEGKPVCVGVSAPGVPDESYGAITCMPGRLAGLEGFAWADYLGVARVPVVNDAVAALIAEHRFGAGKGYRDLVQITLGTGVGGALMINGQIHLGFMQKAGHFGHMSLDPQSTVIGITQIPGSLEDAIGNHNVAVRSFGKYTSTKALVAAHLAGEPIASFVWLNSVQKLAVGLAAIGNMVSPACILLSGGICLAGDALFKPLRAFLDLFEWRPTGQHMEIKAAQFGDFAGAIGAAARAFIEQDAA